MGIENLDQDEYYGDYGYTNNQESYEVKKVQENALKEAEQKAYIRASREKYEENLIKIIFTPEPYKLTDYELMIVYPQKYQELKYSTHGNAD